MALLISIVLLVVLASTSAEVLSGAEKDGILAAHNSMRRLVDPPALDMIELRWSDILASEADEWVKECRSGYDRFINSRTTPWKRLGQNIWDNTTHVGLDVDVVVFDWVRAGSNYSFRQRRCTGSVSSKDCSSFTQVVMAETEFIGCAKNLCKDSIIRLTCFYGPGGNVFFKTPYKAGDTSCSRCPDGYGCDDKLCSPTELDERELIEDLLALLQDV